LARVHLPGLRRLSECSPRVSALVTLHHLRAGRCDHFVVRIKSGRLIGGLRVLGATPRGIQGGCPAQGDPGGIPRPAAGMDRDHPRGLCRADVVVDAVADVSDLGWSKARIQARPGRQSAGDHRAAPAFARRTLGPSARRTRRRLNDSQLAEEPISSSSSGPDYEPGDLYPDARDQKRRARRGLDDVGTWRVSVVPAGTQDARRSGMRCASWPPVWTQTTTGSGKSCPGRIAA
jgi:hypothetical protein